jgi:hypothetical protein
MDIHEIVGAIIDSNSITTDRREIDASTESGRTVEYVSRVAARHRAAEGRSSVWAALAKAPSLFLLDHGIRFVPGHAIR